MRSLSNFSAQQQLRLWNQRLPHVVILVLLNFCVGGAFVVPPSSVHHGHQFHRHSPLQRGQQNEQQMRRKLSSVMLRLPVSSSSSSPSILQQRNRCLDKVTNSCRGWKESTLVLFNSESDNNNPMDDKDNKEPKTNVKEDVFFQGKTTVSLIAGQSVLVVAAVVIAALLQIPNFGLGLTFTLGWPQVQSSLLATIPLAVIAYILDWFEPQVPWLQDVTVATQRSILALLGGTWKPVLAIGVSLLLSLAAGIGEEILFRGVLQYELISRWNDVTAGLLLSSIFFGALHAVTPLYAIMATLASLYFGWLFLHFDNLAIPMLTHTLYDFGAVLYAHYTVSQMTPAQLDAVWNWEGPGTTLTSNKK